MAELDIGKHCHLSDCKQLDFLPVTCSWCREEFCKQHSPPDQHNCLKYGEAAESGEYTGPKAYSCSFQGCLQRELTTVVCLECQNNYCLSHRHQTDHACAMLETPANKMAKTAQHVQKILESKKYPVKKTLHSKKARETAAKVALMKLKMNVKGGKDIPDNEKIYFQVILPLTSKIKTKALVFSKKWSIGKTVDCIANTVSLQNSNNLPDAKKLKLFDLDSGSSYPPEVSIESLVGQEQLFSGSTLIMEYVNSDVFVLDNVDLYKT